MSDINKLIEEEAEKVADKWTTIELRHLYRDGFIAGAKWRNNVLIDEAIDIVLFDGLNRYPGKTLSEALESLKI